jgi:hypothetical protein
MRLSFKIFVIAFIIIVSFNVQAQNSFRTKEAYSKWGIGYNIVSIGYFGVAGPLRNQFTDGLSLVSGLDISYRNLHSFLRVTGSGYTDIRTDLDIYNVKKNMAVEHYFPEISMGYNFSNKKYSLLIPYFGYSRTQSKFWNDELKEYTKRRLCFIKMWDKHFKVNIANSPISFNRFIV